MVNKLEIRNTSTSKFTLKTFQIIHLSNATMFM